MKKVLPRSIRETARNLLRAYQRIRYGGTNVLCPICSSRFSSFAPFGYTKRPNAQCPGCGLLERHRFLWLYLTESTRVLQRKIKLLHFAPEEIFYKRINTTDDIEYFPCDLHPHDFQWGRVLREDITALTFDNDQFDVIICSHVLEHVPNDVRAIAEIFRVLKDDGCAILQVPLEATRAKTHEDLSIIDPAGREKAFGHPEHVRVYGMDFLERLQSVGFSVSVNRAIDLFTPEQVKKHGLDEEEAIYACTK